MHESQCSRILALLQSKPEVNLLEIMQLFIANHTARISGLRKKGYNINCRKEYVKTDKGLHVHTFYSLI